MIRNIVVSASIDNVERHLKASRVRHLFDAVRTKVPNKKAAFQDLFVEYGVTPQQCFYVDDTFDGIAHAKELGIVTFGMLTGCNDEARILAAEPDHPVRSFTEILAILAAGRATA
jgi:phosphoglycolate phosphatase-like HAD superfamily hydrolase